MFTIEDLKPFFDKTRMEINSVSFRLTKEKDMVGELAVWYSEKYKLLATPNFDEIPVPVEVLEIDVNGDWNTIDADGYYGDVNSFEQYTEAVKTLTKNILDNRKTQ